jgi:hypothetical protein
VGFPAKCRAAAEGWVRKWVRCATLFVLAWRKVLIRADTAMSFVPHLFWADGGDAIFFWFQADRAMSFIFVLSRTDRDYGFCFCSFRADGGDAFRAKFVLSGQGDRLNLHLVLSGRGQCSCQWAPNPHICVH